MDCMVKPLASVEIVDGKNWTGWKGNQVGRAEDSLGCLKGVSTHLRPYSWPHLRPYSEPPKSGLTYDPIPGLTCDPILNPAKVASLTTLFLASLATLFWTPQKWPHLRPYSWPHLRPRKSGLTYDPIPGLTCDPILRNNCKKLATCYQIITISDLCSEKVPPPLVSAYKVITSRMSNRSHPLWSVRS